MNIVHIEDTTRAQMATKITSTEKIHQESNITTQLQIKESTKDDIQLYTTIPKNPPTLTQSKTIEDIYLESSTPKLIIISTPSQRYVTILN